MLIQDSSRSVDPGRTTDSQIALVDGYQNTNNIE
jgi:hypothetical protein